MRVFLRVPGSGGPEKTEDVNCTGQYVENKEAEKELCYGQNMPLYRDAGVDVHRGDLASACAYAHARSTHVLRKGRIGKAVAESEGGFAGLLDMGPYFLVQTSDGTGTKMEIAERLGIYESIGRDLLAMVADDAVCTGAEVLGVSNTLDVRTVDPALIDPLLRGFSLACIEQGIVITGGEIAEVPGSVSVPVWNATAVGIVEKDRVLRPETIVPGDTVIALRERGCRSNGFSLIRKILQDAFGEQWHTKEYKAAGVVMRAKDSGDVPWARLFLQPSTIYHAALLKLLGRYGEPQKIQIRGLAHITGGGIPSKLRRILKQTGYGAELHDLWSPPTVLVDLLQMGGVSQEEAYRTFCMGNGMLVVLPIEERDRALTMLGGAGVEARVAGAITRDPEIVIATAGGDLRYEG